MPTAVLVDEETAARHGPNRQSLETGDAASLRFSETSEFTDMQATFNSPQDYLRNVPETRATFTPTQSGILS